MITELKALYIKTLTPMQEGIMTTSAIKNEETLMLQLHVVSKV